MPAVRRRRPVEDEHDEEEEPRRRRPRDEDEDEEEERPRRRAARDEDDDDDEEDERPARRGRPRASDDDDEDDRPRRRSRDDDDDEEEAPRRRSDAVRKGWSGFKTNKEKASDFPEELRISEELELFVFLEDEPFATYRQHWIDNPPDGIRKKSWTCLDTDDCPLCEIGDRPTQKNCFNILHLNTGGDPANKVLTVGNRVADLIFNLHKDKKTGPISREDRYFTIKRTGKGAQSTTLVTSIKERDVVDDWDLDPLTPSERKTAMKSLYDETIVQEHPKKQLRELARGIAGDE